MIEQGIVPSRDVKKVMRPKVMVRSVLLTHLRFNIIEPTSLEA